MGVPKQQKLTGCTSSSQDTPVAPRQKASDDKVAIEQTQKQQKLDQYAGSVQDAASAQRPKAQRLKRIETLEATSPLISREELAKQIEGASVFDVDWTMCCAR